MQILSATRKRVYISIIPSGNYFIRSCKLETRNRPVGAFILSVFGKQDLLKLSLRIWQARLAKTILANSLDLLKVRKRRSLTFRFRLRLLLVPFGMTICCEHVFFHNRFFYSPVNLYRTTLASRGFRFISKS